MADRHGALSYSLAANLSKNGYRNALLIDERISTPAHQPETLRLIQERNFSDTDKLSLTPRLNWAFGNGDTLSWQSLLDLSRNTYTGSAHETTVLGKSTLYPENHANAKVRASALRSDLSWNRQVGADGKLSVKAGLNYNKRNTDYTFLGLSQGSEDSLLRGVVSSATDDSYTSSGKYLTRFREDHSLGFGWDGGITHRSEERLQRDRVPDGAALGELDEDYTANVRRLAFFAQDEWAVTPRLQVYLGMRWEGLDTATAGRTLNKVHNRSGVWSPVAQLLWQLPDSEKDQFRLALSRTYKAPPTRNLVPRRYTRNNDNGPTNPDVQGNPDLRPELAWGLDLAYERYFGKSGVLSVSTFARRIRDVTVQRLYQQGGAWISTPFNDGTATVHGIEFDTKFPLRTWFAGAPDIDVHANASRNCSRLDTVPGPNNRLSEQTPLSANVGLDYRPTPALSTGLNLNLQTGGLVQVTGALRSYSGVNRMLDWYGLWKLDRTTQLRLSLANILRTSQQRGQFFADEGGATARMSTAPVGTGVRLVFEHTL